MFKITQKIIMLSSLVVVASSCSQLPEDPRTWESLKSENLKKNEVQINPVTPVTSFEDHDGQVSHPVNPNNPEDKKGTNTF